MKSYQAADGQVNQLAEYPIHDALHHDSKSGVLHQHINANRIDMNGNQNA